MRVFQRIGAVGLLVLLCGSPAVAQQLASGNIGTTGESVSAFVPANVSSVCAQAAGTWTGTLTFQGSADGVTFVSLLGSNQTSGATATTTTSNGVFCFGKLAVVRVYGTSIASGTASVTLIQGGGGSGGGGGGGGSVTQGTTPWVVDGTGGTFPATQSGTWAAAILDESGNPIASNANAGTRALATVIYDASGNAVTSFGGSGGTAGADDMDFTAGTTQFTPVGGFYQSTVTACTDGDACAAGITTGRAVKFAPSLADGSVAWLATNGAAAATNRIGTLPAVVNNAAPSYTDGRDAALSVTTGGAQRVMITNAAGTATTIATDSTADSAAGTTGPQVMAKGKNTTLPTAVTDGDAVQLLADLRGRLTPKNVCADPDLVSSVVISTASSGNVELVALSGSTVVTVCGFNVMAGGTVGVQFISGTGSACGTGETNKTGVYPLIVNSGINTGFGSKVFAGAAGEAVCVELSGAVQIDGILTYVQQ